MDTLSKKGYLISISDWMGNLGNHLRQLSGAINIAQKTQSRLTIPNHKLIKRKHYDFLDKRNDNCFEPVVGRFFFKSDCFQYPLTHDYERRKLLQEYVHNQLSVKTVWERLRDLVMRRRDENVGPDTLVINIRSGRDIFCDDPSPPARHYMQPPLSYYKHIIQSNNYEDVVIVTEPDQQNPCIPALLSWNRRIRIKIHVSIGDDFRTLLNATHLVMCHSTFSWCIACMSKKLQTLHQPDSCVIRGIRDYSIYTYKFRNYIEPGEWTCSPEQLERMLNHPLDQVRVSHVPRWPGGGYDQTELSRCS